MQTLKKLVYQTGSLISLRKYLYLFFLVSTLPLDVFCQGNFLGIGESGFKFAGGIFTNEAGSGFGGSFGYSVRGILDYGLYVGRISFTDKLLDEKLSATVISPSATYYILKQSKNIPLSFSVGVNYEWQYFSNQVLENLQIEMTSRYFGIDAKLFKYFFLQQSYIIQPVLEASYLMGKFLVTNDLAGEYSEEDDFLIWRVGISLGIYRTQNNIVILDPKVSFNKNITTYSLFLALVFSTY